jgi:hypothetical protein
MKKILFFVILLFPLLCQAQGFNPITKGATGVVVDSNCDQAKYYPMLAPFCQNKYTGKIYKGTGAAVVEVGTATTGTGDVSGPAASSASELPLYDGTGGKTLKRSNSLNGVVFLTDGVVTVKTIGASAGNVVAGDHAHSGVYLPVATIDDSKGNGDTSYVWSADKSYDQLALKLNATALDDTKGNGDTTFIWSADKTFDQLALKAASDHTHTGVYEPADANIYKITTTLGTFTGTILSDGDTIKGALQELETAFEGLSGGHTQNTDTGTTSSVFQLSSGASGPKIKNNSGVTEIRNAADNAYAAFKSAAIDGTTITASDHFAGNITGDVTGNVSGTAGGLSGTPALPNGTTATTQAAADNSTKVATTAYADRMVTKALYDANTILYATSDDAPAALTVGASTIVGRKASGNIVALTGAEVLTISGASPVAGSSSIVTVGTVTSGNVDAVVSAASTSAAGKVELATNAETVTGTSTTLVVTPDDLTYRLASPSAIGGTAPAAGTFTTLTAGGGGVSCDADGDCTFKSVSVTRVAGQASYSEFFEIPANGNSKVTLKAPDSLAADYTVTLPSETGTVCSTGSVCTGYQAALTNAVTGTGTSGNMVKFNGTSTVTDGPKLGTFTDAKWCTYTTADGLKCTSDTPAGAGDVTGGSTSATGEIAAYTDTGGKAITRSYVVFSGPSTSAKTKTISNAYDTIAEVGQANNFSAAQTISAVNAASGSATASTLSGTLGIFNGSDTFRGIYLNYANANHTGTGNTVAIIDIAAITGDANSNLYGMRIGALTGTSGAAGEVEDAIIIGAGWDADIAKSAGILIIGGTGSTNNEKLTLDFETTANTVGISSGSGVTDINFSTLNLITTGTIQGSTKINSDADGMSAAEMTTVGLGGTMFIATGAGTWILPDVAAAGQSLCLMDSGTAHDLILDVTAGSTIRLKGTEQADVVGITNAAGTTTGDFVCVMSVAAHKWSTVGMGGTWASQ